MRKCRYELHPCECAGGEAQSESLDYFFHFQNVWQFRVADTLGLSLQGFKVVCFESKASNCGSELQPSEWKRGMTWLNTCRGWIFFLLSPWSSKLATHVFVSIQNSCPFLLPLLTCFTYTTMPYLDLRCFSRFQLPPLSIFSLIQTTFGVSTNPLISRSFPNICFPHLADCFCVLPSSILWMWQFNLLVSVLLWWCLECASFITCLPLHMCF